MDLAAVIICGGASRRMGVDKAVLEIDGERLIDRVARRLETVADPIFVASGKPGRLGALPWPEVADIVEDGGPAAGLVAGLQAAQDRGATAVAAVAADLPDVDPAVLQALAQRLASPPQGATRHDVVVPVGPDHIHWLHAVWSTHSAGVLRQGLDAGRRSFRDLTSSLAVDRISFADDRFGVNLNTTEELERYLKRSPSDERPAGPR